jgi:hypothetical protein
MEVDDILDDIYAMEGIIKKYEKKYGITSRTFYTLYRAGKLDDSDFERTREFSDWASAYAIKLEREQEFEELSCQHLAALQLSSGVLQLEASSDLKT